MFLPFTRLGLHTNLLKLAQPKIQDLLDFFGEIRVELQRDVYNDLIPRLQKYISNPSSSTLTVTEANNPPSIPTFSTWSSMLFRGMSMEYGASATDPDNDEVSITFDWGDGDQSTEGPAASGTPLYSSHSWSNTGMYEVKGRASDTHGSQSDWSPPVDVTVLTSVHEDIWAGYLVRSSTTPITSVEGRFYVPTLGTEKYGIHGIWVGIGGNGPSVPLLQAGVEAVTHPDIGKTMYCAFVERDPGRPSHYIYEDNPGESGCHISPGDAMRVTISALATPGDWTIEIEDITRAWTLTFPSVTWSTPDQTTAEWIFEPGAKGTSIPSSFETITFGGATLQIDSTVYDMGMVGHTLDVDLYKCVVVREEEDITDISPIDNYNIFQISDTGNRPPPPPPVPITSMSLHSSAELHVYDSSGNHLGYNSTTGFVDAQIPGSFYFEDGGVQYALLFNSDSYEVTLLGIEDGDFHLHTQIISNETVTLDQWVNETIVIDETKTYNLIHQISLQDLENSKTATGQGYNCSISVVVFNNGNYTETFNVTAYANTTIIGTQPVTLTRGNSTTITFIWNTAGVPYGNYTISANTTIIQGETNTSDNNKTGGWVLVTIPGDFNGNGVVEGLDYGTFGAAWNSEEGYPDWDPNCDFNNNGVIEGLDYGIFGAHWGQHI